MNALGTFSKYWAIAWAIRKWTPMLRRKTARVALRISGRGNCNTRQSSGRAVSMAMNGHKSAPMVFVIPKVFATVTATAGRRVLVHMALEAAVKAGSDPCGRAAQQKGVL